VAQKLLSIDIREDLVSGVLVTAGSSGTAVVNCGVSIVEADDYAASLEELLAHLDYDDGPCRISFGAENFYYRNLSFPFADKRKIEKILSIELEENLAVEMDELLVDSLVTGKQDGESAVIAAMVERQFVRERMAELAALNLDPEILAISGVQTALQLAGTHTREDFVLLDIGCRRLTMFALLQGRMRIIRSMVFDDGSLASFSMDRNSQLVSAKSPQKTHETFRVLAREIRRTLYALDDAGSDPPFYLTGPLAGLPDCSKLISDELETSVIACDLVGSSLNISQGCGLWRADVMTSPLALAVRTRKKQAGFNFRKEEFSKKISYARYKKLLPQLGIPLVLYLVAAVGYLWNDYSIREKKLLSLKKQGEEIFMATLPGVTRIVDPVQQLKVEIRELNKGTLGEVAAQNDLRILDLMAEVSVRIPKSINVHVVRMVADNKSVLLRGLTDNFNSVDSLKKVLEKSNYFGAVTINSANLATKSAGIRFELKLQLNRG